MILINYLVFTAKVLGLICAIVFLISLIISIIENNVNVRKQRKLETEGMKIINEKLKTMSAKDILVLKQKIEKIED